LEVTDFDKLIGVIALHYAVEHAPIVVAVMLATQLLVHDLAHLAVVAVGHSALINVIMLLQHTL